MLNRDSNRNVNNRSQDKRKGRRERRGEREKESERGRGGGREIIISLVAVRAVLGKKKGKHSGAFKLIRVGK